MRDFSAVRKLVVKVGTNLLSSKDGIDEKRIESFVRQIFRIKERGVQVLLVSSGAVGMGAKKMGHVTPVVHTPLRQAYAAIGMPLLMSTYEREFGKYDLITAQVLITRSVLNNRKSYINLRSSVATLLALGVVPIFNENDVVSTAEIESNNFGDNDRLSAFVASKIDADLLVLLTDIDGLYDKNPKKEEGARLIDEISDIDEGVMSYARGKGSAFSTGGMKTKLIAAKIAQEGGCGTVIASGYEEDVLIKILDGENIGTYIKPHERLSQKARWIRNTSAVGTLVVDDGASRALLMHSSLLTGGIKEIRGIFAKGDVVKVEDLRGKELMKAITKYDSTELESLIGKKNVIVFRPEDSYGGENA